MTASWRSGAPTIERMTTHLSMRAAICLKTSPIWMPVTLVLIGLNSPRISFGRLGLDLPHILMRRSAAEEDVDDRLVTRAWPSAGLSLDAEEIRESERSGANAERPDAQKTAPVDTVAVAGFLAEDGEHSS